MKDRLVEIALECGAARAVVIPQSQIALSAEFRNICRKNSCGNYGKFYSCPPDIGDIQTLMAQVRRYSHGLLYQSVTMVKDSFDFAGMMQAGKTHGQLSQNIHQAVKPLVGGAMLHMTAGGCYLCKTCVKQVGEPCRFPEHMLPQLEGCGVDVYNTVKHTDMKYINGKNTVTYFGLLLFME